MIEYINGPWKILFDGTFDEYPLRILINGEGYMITEIINLKNNVALLSTLKIVKGEGDFESFVETLPKNTIFNLIKEKDSINKFLFIKTQSQIVNIDSEKIKEYTIENYNKVKKDEDVIKNIAKSYELKIIDYKELNKDELKPLFLNPILFSNIFETRQVEHMDTKIVEKIEFKTNLMKIGFKKEDNTLNEDKIEKFDGINLVTVKDLKVRKKIAQVLAEEYSFAKINNIIITHESSFENMKYPSENEKDIKEKLNTNPIGFPVEINNLGSECTGIEFDRIPKEVLREIFRLGEDNVSNFIINLFEQKKPKNVAEFIKYISEEKPNDNVTSYDIEIARRMIETINQIYSEVINEVCNIQKLTKPFKEKFGKINIILLKEENRVKNQIVLYSIVQKLTENLEKINLIIENGEELFNIEDNSKLLNSINKELDKLKDKSVYIFTSDELDLNKNTKEIIKSQINLIQDRDIAVRSKNDKPYRVILRDTLSKD